MNNKSLRKQQKQEQTLSGQETQRQAGLEFGSVEEMLRHDALHTPVPPAIAHRLSESVGQLPAPPRPWWRRLFGS